MKKGAGTKNEPDGGVIMTEVASSSRKLPIPAPLALPQLGSFVCENHVARAIPTQTRSPCLHALQ